jgi:hypothetical protein
VNFIGTIVYAALAWAIRKGVLDLLLQLGIGVVAFAGTDTLLSWFRDQAVAGLQGLPAQTLSLLSFMKVGVAINIIFSAYVARFAGDAAGGAIKRWQIK